MKIALALLAAFAAAAVSATTLRAEPRAWTSADGRQINGEYLGRAADGSALVIARSDTGARVTVPVAALSADDQTYAATLPTKAAPPPPEDAQKAAKEKLAALAANYPKPPAGDSAEIAEVKRRFEGPASTLATGDIAANCRALRLKISRETQAISAPLDIKIDLNDSMERATKIRQRQAATRSALAWMAALTKHAEKVEAEAAKIGATEVAKN